MGTEELQTAGITSWRGKQHRAGGVLGRRKPSLHTADSWGEAPAATAVFKLTAKNCI